jgi:hypothetical protein
MAPMRDFHGDVKPWSKPLKLLGRDHKLALNRVRPPSGRLWFLVQASATPTQAKALTMPNLILIRVHAWRTS